MAKQFGKDVEVDFAASNLMSFGKSFSTLNGQPIVKSEVWYDYASLETFAKSDAAYVGQEVAYIDVEKSKVTRYIIQIDGSLKEGGASAIGDEGTIVIAEDGTISLAGVEGLEFSNTSEDGTVTKITYQPLLVDGKLTWVQPSATTVEGLASEIEGIKVRLAIIEGAGEGSIKKIAEDTATAKVAEIVAGADTDFDTLKEVADWIKNDTTGAVKMQSQIADIIGEDTDDDGSAKSMREVATDVVTTKISASEKTLSDKIIEAEANAKAYTDTKAYDDAAIKASIKSNTDAIATINDESTGVLAEAKKYTDTKVYDDTQIKSDIKANADAITVLNGENTVEGSVKKTVADEVAAIVAGAPKDFDTLKEIADWIANDTTGAAKMANDIAIMKGTDEGKSIREIATEVSGNIPFATQTVLGLIKGTEGKVGITNGEIVSVSTDILTQGSDILVLDGNTDM